MNNNNLDQISMRSSRRRRERFNHKHKNETSMSIGEIQPLMCREVVPNSKTNIKVTNVVRLAPMVAPTFGEMKLHHNFMFVGMSDLTDKFSALLANEPVAFGGGLVQVPKYVPWTTLQVLSAFILIGAKCTIYPAAPYASADDSKNEVTLRRWHYLVNSSWSSSSDPLYQIIYPQHSGTHSSEFETAMKDLHGIASYSDSNVETASELWCDNLATRDPVGHWQTAFKNYDGAGLNVGRILGWNHDFWVPSANFSPWTFLTSYTYQGNDSAALLKSSRFYNGVVMNLDDVTPDNADYTIYAKLGDSYFAFCFHLSDFGKRLRKILLACGYGVDFKSKGHRSIMKLFALYKAWFDSFGITLYQGWETTNCARCLQMYDSDYLNDFEAVMTSADSNPPSVRDVTNRQTFVAFMADLADIWYTEEQDFVTAHIRTAAVSPNDGVPSGLVATPNVNGQFNVDDSAVNSGEPGSVLVDTTNVGGHAYINNVLHSQLDSELLKRLYKVTNRNTIAGRRIAELLKAQGLGDYMKRCKSRFIGHWSCDIEVFDVTSTTDNFDPQNKTGSVLGEYVGKGVGEGKSKLLSYETSEFGFVIDLAAIVPESGWMNGEDLSVRNVGKLDFYNPEYDGLGYEISPKSVVAGDQTFASLTNAGASVHDLSFGFVPRYTKHKVVPNIGNGDFTLRSTRDGYLPFSLDKFVDVGNRNWREREEGSASDPMDSFVVHKLLTPERLPIASPMYRYLARYPWMGHLLRIFANVGRDQIADDFDYYENFERADGEAVNTWYLLNSPDNFIVHNVFLVDYYAPMLAIEDSFETHEDGNNGGSDMAIGKA